MLLLTNFTAELQENQKEKKKNVVNDSPRNIVDKKKIHAYFVYVLYSVNIRIACHKQEGETLSVLDVLPSLTFKLPNRKCFKWNLMHSMSKWCKNSIGPTSVVLILERSESAAVNVSMWGQKKKKKKGKVPSF